MPCRLVPYPNSAQFGDQKLVRSIQSVLDQTFADFELIVISDGCELTKEIVKDFFTDKRIVLLECVHKQIFDNTPRNTGINNAKGDYIIYIDADDFWGPDHLTTVNKNLKFYDWVWYNDLIPKNGWTERPCNIRILGGCGTSNVCYKRKLNVKWDRPGYSHDFHFIQRLRNFRNNIKVQTPEYYVMHTPGAGGWDL